MDKHKGRKTLSFESLGNNLLAHFFVRTFLFPIFFHHSTISFHEFPHVRDLFFMKFLYPRNIALYIILRCIFDPIRIEQMLKRCHIS